MRLVYLGSGDIGLPTLRALAAAHEIAAVVAQPDQPAGRGNQLREPPTKTLARELGLPVLQPERVRRPEAVQALREVAADAFVVFAYGQILPQAVLDLPRLAALNIHASLLPRWRGAAPIQAAIRAGDAVSGHTIMFMDAGLDTGDILLQREVPLAEDETGGSLFARLSALAPECILEALELLAAGRAPRVPQNSALSTLAPKLERPDGRIEWRHGVLELSRRIRAFEPWPGSFTTLPDGRLLKVFGARLASEHGRSDVAPGTVLGPDGDGALVACADGAVRLAEFQPEGRRRLSARDWFNGGVLRPGMTLGA
ncbi:MAG: methionyl-tRNA formyltransferase [Verrucomicrobia bacterium]|nr:methionyl-tRNA formyltransferase [Verrucomicrobiota bacterium]